MKVLMAHENEESLHLLEKKMLNLEKASEASEHASALFQIFQTFSEREFMAECKN